MGVYVSSVFVAHGPPLQEQRPCQNSMGCCFCDGWNYRIWRFHFLVVWEDYNCWLWALLSHPLERGGTHVLAAHTTQTPEAQHKCVTRVAEEKSSFLREIEGLSNDKTRFLSAFFSAQFCD